MLEYDPHRSEFALASRVERGLQVAVLAFALVGAVWLFLERPDGKSEPGVWMGGAVAAIALVPFVPGRRWRLAFSLIALALMAVAIVAN